MRFSLSFAALALLFISAQATAEVGNTGGGSGGYDDYDNISTQAIERISGGHISCFGVDCASSAWVAADDKNVDEPYYNTSGKLVTPEKSNNSGNSENSVTGSARLDAECAAYLKGADNLSETSKKMCGGRGDDSASATGETDAGGESFTSYGTRNGGRQAWRIPKEGPRYGKSIKVVFSDGHTVIVPDTSKCYREKDGFVFKPGTNGEYSETGTAHGGVYLHAPYGNSSTKATFYPN
ncbi:MAG TPA: hypothetical protein DCY07_06670 [Rhodospirillaceae bacterium]|nr:hypothetical protein [Rhodospirillaceae bacterium]